MVEYDGANDSNHESNHWQGNDEWYVFFRDTAIHRALHVEVGLGKRKRNANGDASCSLACMIWHIFRKTTLEDLPHAKCTFKKLDNLPTLEGWKVRSLQVPFAWYTFPLRANGREINGVSVWRFRGQVP